LTLLYRRVELFLSTCLARDLATSRPTCYAQRHQLPDAILGANDQIGLAAMIWLRRRGLQVPEDVVVTGYNALESWSYSELVLTTVRSPAYDIRARGGAVILDRLQYGRFPNREEIFPVSLQIGGST